MKLHTAIVASYIMQKFTPTPSNEFKCTVLLHKGDGGQGLKGRPPLWFKPSAWAMFLMEADLQAINDINNIEYRCTKKFICAQTLPLIEFIEVDVVVVHDEQKQDFLDLPNCDKLNCARIVDLEIQHNKVLNLFKASAYRSYPAYITAEINGMVDVV